MRILRLLPLLLPVFGTWAADPSLEAALARMDAAAAKFHGLRADVKRVTHTEVMHLDEVETGKIAVRRPTPKDLRMKTEIQNPNPRTVWFAGTKSQVYYPKINTVQEFGLGKASGLKDQLMALGFGSTSKELGAAYTMQLGGSDTVGGQPATRLVLIPREQQMRSLFPKVELWLSDAGIAVQQKLYESGGDYLMATFTNIQQADRKSVV